MAILENAIPERRVSSTMAYTDGRPPVISYSNPTISRTYIDKPVSTRRKKPSDLFANRTARTVESSSSQCHSPSIRAQTASGVTQTVYQYLASRPTWIPSLNFTGHVNDVLNGLKDTKVNLSVSIPELGKTTDMVADLARDVFTAFRNLRRGRFGTVIKGPKGVSLSDRAAKRWLQYVYGIVPTMSDIYGLSEYIHRKITSGDEFLYYRKWFRLSDRYLVDDPRTKAVFQTIGRRSFTVRYQADSSKLLSLKQAGITNPALTIYELMPYSFVLDWIIDISGYLSALDALVGLRNVSYATGYRYTTDFDISFADPQVGWVVTQWGRQTAKRTVTYRSATAYNLTPEYPRYDPHLGVRRMISAVALLKTF